MAITSDKTLAATRPPLRYPRVSRRALVGVVGLLAGCADSPPRTGEVRNSLIYGDDTRRDVYTAGELGRLALQSSIAFVSPEHLVRDPAGRFAIVADTLGASNNLCPGEAFFAQPAAATCSGVLVDDRLVVTAGHCVRDDATCDDRLLVFDYAVTDPERTIAMDADAIYACKSVVVRVSAVDATGRHLDFAFIELDRPVTADRRPVALSVAALPPSSPVTVIGYPSGLPVKIDAGAHVLYARPCGDYFTIDSDTFEASSGSGVFDELGRLSGLFVRGGPDYRFVPDRHCAVPRQIAEVDDPRDAEQASYLGPAIAALCASGRANARLCSAIAVRVSDIAGPEGACATDTEDPGGCAAAGSHRGRGSSAALIALVAVLQVRRRRASAGVEACTTTAASAPRHSSCTKTAATWAAFEHKRRRWRSSTAADGELAVSPPAPSRGCSSTTKPRVDAAASNATVGANCAHWVLASVAGVDQGLELAAKNPVALSQFINAS